MTKATKEYAPRHNMGPKCGEQVPVSITPGQCVIWRCTDAAEDRYCVKHADEAPKPAAGRRKRRRR